MTKQHSPRPADTADRAIPMRLVFIRDLELAVRIGIHRHEHANHQPVRINVELSVDDTGAGDDRLDRVVDYEAVALRIRALATQGHINLAETLAERVAAACLEDPRVRSARVRVEKLHALAGAGSAGVEIERQANR